MSKRIITQHQKKRMEEISLFIKNFRINDGLTQSDFSKLSEIHHNTIQRFEAGNKNITISTLFNMIDAMEMSLSEFFENME
jgi:transcriptional regulator with XRE-family HTH domain